MRFLTCHERDGTKWSDNHQRHEIHLTTLELREFCHQLLYLAAFVNSILGVVRTTEITVMQFDSILMARLPVFLKISDIFSESKLSGHWIWHCSAAIHAEYSIEWRYFIDATVCQTDRFLDSTQTWWKIVQYQGGCFWNSSDWQFIEYNILMIDTNIQWLDVGTAWHPVVILSTEIDHSYYFGIHFILQRGICCWHSFPTWWMRDFRSLEFCCGYHKLNDWSFHWMIQRSSLQHNFARVTYRQNSCWWC